jgi:hypothetical protein
MHLVAKYELHLRRNAVAIADLEKHLIEAREACVKLSMSFFPFGPGTSTVN